MTYRIANPDFTADFGKDAIRGTYLDIWVNPTFENNHASVAIDGLQVTVENGWDEQLPARFVTWVNNRRDNHAHATYLNLIVPQLAADEIATVLRWLGFPGMYALVYKAYGRGHDV
jgi:hypothetical protein